MAKGYYHHIPLQAADMGDPKSDVACIVFGARDVKAWLAILNRLMRSEKAAEDIKSKADWLNKKGCGFQGGLTYMEPNEDLLPHFTLTEQLVTWFLQFYTLKGDTVWQVDPSLQVIACGSFALAAVASKRQVFVMVDNSQVKDAISVLNAAEEYVNHGEMWMLYKEPVRVYTIMAITKATSELKVSTAFFVSSQHGLTSDDVCKSFDDLDGLSSTRFKVTMSNPEGQRIQCLEKVATGNELFEAHTLSHVHTVTQHTTTYTDNHTQVFKGHWTCLGFPDPSVDGHAEGGRPPASFDLAPNCHVTYSSSKPQFYDVLSYTDIVSSQTSPSEELCNIKVEMRKSHESIQVFAKAIMDVEIGDDLMNFKKAP